MPTAIRAGRPSSPNSSISSSVAPFATSWGRSNPGEVATYTATRRKRRIRSIEPREAFNALSACSVARRARSRANVDGNVPVHEPRMNHFPSFHRDLTRHPGKVAVRHYRSVRARGFRGWREIDTEGA